MRLLVAEVLEHVLDNGLDEVGLLAFLGLLLETNPAVKDGLDLGRERDLLALDERLGLELRGLLRAGVGVSVRVERFVEVGWRTGEGRIG